jgi:hypothetical protein
MHAWPYELPHIEEARLSTGAQFKRGGRFPKSNSPDCDVLAYPILASEERPCLRPSMKSKNRLRITKHAKAPKQLMIFQVKF